jgi:hypothetical protein
VVILASGHALLALHERNLFSSALALQLELCVAQNSDHEQRSKIAPSARDLISRNTAKIIGKFAKGAAVKLDRDALFFYCP